MQLELKVPNFPKLMLLLVRKSLCDTKERHQGLVEAHPSYETYWLGTISIILSRPEGSRKATCVFGRMYECMARRGYEPDRLAYAQNPNMARDAKRRGWKSGQALI